MQIKTDEEDSEILYEIVGLQPIKTRKVHSNMLTIDFKHPCLYCFVVCYRTHLYYAYTDKYTFSSYIEHNATIERIIINDTPTDNLIIELCSLNDDYVFELYFYPTYVDDSLSEYNDKLTEISKYLETNKGRLLFMLLQ